MLLNELSLRVQESLQRGGNVLSIGIAKPEDFVGARLNTCFIQSHQRGTSMTSKSLAEPLTMMLVGARINRDSQLKPANHRPSNRPKPLVIQTTEQSTRRAALTSRDWQAEQLLNHLSASVEALPS